MTGPVLILGCGYVGSRVARRLVDRGCQVYVTSRHPESLYISGAHTTRVSELGALPRGLRVLHSVPLNSGSDAPVDHTPELLASLPGLVKRIVYLSTTSVYGAQTDVDERTLPAPTSLSGSLRLHAEAAVQSGGWSSLILRPAAIYGPGRGIQVSLPAGRFPLAGDGSNFVSRIHVEDLAALAAAALFSSVTGAYPVADEDPARSRDIAQFVCDLLGCPMPQSASAEQLHETRRANRRVDGRAICRLIGVTLRYPSYRSGIPAALQSQR